MTDFVAEMNRKQAALDADDARAKAKGMVVGRYIQHSHADSYAVYKITAAAGAMVRIEWVEIGDAWVLPAWGKKTNISLASAKRFLAHRDALAMTNAHDAWWAKQKVGSIVHYSNGFNSYVRGVVVIHDGRHQMRPIALVGNWRQYDLWNRAADGTVTYSHHVKGIVDGKIFEPNYSNMVENPEHRLRPGAVDPRGQKPVIIEVPELSNDEKVLADLLQFRAMVIERLDFVSTNDPVEDAKIIRAALKAAMMLAATALE